jgi:transglutaminase-like putative cysteine protease
VIRSRGLVAAAGALLLTAFVSAPARGDEHAVYLAEGEDIRLFDHYDNDGYSLAVLPAAGGSVELRVSVDDSPLASTAPFPTGSPRDSALAPSPERDRFAHEKALGSRTQAEAVSRILVAVADRLRYDPARGRPQDPAAVFTSGRADCVGFAELAVDLLRRIGIRARTVQGIVRTGPDEPAHDPRIGGSYHRWIEVYYPDRGYVFSDPSVSINGVDARYLPFRTRSLTRPRSLTLVFVDRSGTLSYAPVASGRAKLRERVSVREAAGGRR